MIKKYLFRSLFLAFIVFFCTACPYDSAVPITEPTFFEKQLLGKWKQEVQGAKDEDYIEVRKLDTHQYWVVEYEYHQNTKTFSTQEYAAHLSEINGTKFLNVVNKVKPDGYFLYKIKHLSAEKVVLLPLSEHIREKFHTSTELRGFVATHMGLSFFYGAEQRFKKLPK